MDFALLASINGADRDRADLKPLPGRNEKHFRFVLVSVALTEQERHDVAMNHPEPALRVWNGLAAPRTDLP